MCDFCDKYANVSGKQDICQRVIPQDRRCPAGK